MAAATAGGPLPPCPPPSDASLRQGGDGSSRSSVNSATPKLVSAGLSAARHHTPFDEDRSKNSQPVPVLDPPPPPKNRKRASFIGSKFRVSGFQVIGLGVLSLIMLGVFLYGVVSLAKVTDYEVQASDLRDVKDSYRKVLEENKELRVVFETCKGETGELRGALHTAVAEQEKLQEVVDTSEPENAQILLILTSIISLMIGFIAGRKTSPIITTTHTNVQPVETDSLDPPPEQFTQNELAEVFSADGWIPCTVLRSDAKSTVVLTGDGISITLKPGDTCIRKKLTCTKCKSLSIELADMSRSLADVQVENSRLPELEEAARNHANEVFKMESRLKKLEATLRREEDGHSIAVRECKQLRADYHQLQSKKEEEDMRITEDLVSLASRELDAKLVREKRRRQEIEEHYEILSNQCNCLKSQLAFAEEQILDSERRCAAAASKFLSAAGGRSHHRRL
eukprot:TRINITY_DN7784_c0_g1_i1.p1 TRINITY_DN7784_c0_g1~~TRINITY_DN7784_c0_g1_i1.p1  ORF type:complete len:454 (+),score=103.77 TRINITY_DN7784_c0_g1_i1:40-1401(+)